MHPYVASLKKLLEQHSDPVLAGHQAICRPVHVVAHQLTVRASR